MQKLVDFILLQINNFCPKTYTYFHLGGGGGGAAARAPMNIYIEHNIETFSINTSKYNIKTFFSHQS